MLNYYLWVMRYYPLHALRTVWNIVRRRECAMKDCQTIAQWHFYLHGGEPLSKESLWFCERHANMVMRGGTFAFRDGSSLTL